LKLAQSSDGQGQQLIAQSAGTFDIDVYYQLPVTKEAVENNLVLPVRNGLVNRLNVTVVNADVDVLSSEAVSVQRELIGSNTVARLVLSPGEDCSVTWK